MSAAEGRALVVIERGELEAMIERAVARALEVRPAAPEWLDTRATAKMLDVSTRTVAKMVARGELPCTRVGKLLRFKRSDVAALLDGA